MTKCKVEDLRKSYQISEIDLDWNVISAYANDRIALIDNGTFYGRIPAKDQRAIFNGLFIGKGQILIDVKDQAIFHYVKVAFGQDTEWNLMIQAIPQPEPEPEQSVEDSAMKECAESITKHAQAMLSDPKNADFYAEQIRLETEELRRRAVQKNQHNNRSASHDY